MIFVIYEFLKGKKIAQIKYLHIYQNFGATNYFLGIVLLKFQLKLKMKN